MPAPTRSLSRFVWLSIAAAVITFSMKGTAAVLTGSVGLMSDAAESVVNLVAAVVALIAIKVSEKPEDAEHAYGHGKAEYLSAGVEGTLIVIAAITIGVAAIDRLIRPVGLEDLGIGLVITTGASLINLGVAIVLMRGGKRERSITLEADGKHLMTDVWTSAGVLFGDRAGRADRMGCARPLDGPRGGREHRPRRVQVGAAFGAGTARRRGAGGDRQAIDDVLASFSAHDVQFHAVRTRQAGRRAFVAMHVLVPGAWPVQQGHDLLERIEADIRDVVPDITIDTHLEPLEDPASFADESLDRRSLPPSAGPELRRDGKGPWTRRPNEAGP